MKSKPKGRPPTERGAYNPIPHRIFGRVPQLEWDELKAASRAAGKTFTAWALEILLKAARKQPTAKPVARPKGKK